MSTASDTSNKRVLTDKYLQALRPAPAGKRITIWDAVVPGFGVRVSDRAGRGGRAANLSFVVMRRRPGESTPTRRTIGRYHPTALPLVKAREDARKELEAIAAGAETVPLNKRRKAEAEGRRRQQSSRDAQAFAAVAELFIRRHVTGLRTSRAVEALIRRELIPVLGDRPIGEIRRRDLIELLERVVDRGNRDKGVHRRLKTGGEHAARHTLAAARKLFNWALARDIEGLDANPCGRIKVADLLGPPKVRDRVLTDDELRLVWRAAEATPYPFGPLVRALLLTGQRLREIAEAQWTEVAGGMLTIPAQRMKGKVAHTVPLTPRVLALLSDLPRFAGGEYLFTTTGGIRPISGYSKMKARLDRTVSDLARADRAALRDAGLSAEEASDRVRDVDGFTLHDLRRTVRTGMARAEVPVFVAELVIGHRQSGVHAVYDLHTYDAEKRDALERWERRLAAIVEPPPAIVVPMPTRKTATVAASR